MDIFKGKNRYFSLKKALSGHIIRCQFLVYGPYICVFILEQKKYCIFEVTCNLLGDGQLFLFNLSICILVL